MISDRCVANLSRCALCGQMHVTLIGIAINRPFYCASCVIQFPSSTYGKELMWIQWPQLTQYAINL